MHALRPATTSSSRAAAGVPRIDPQSWAVARATRRARETEQTGAGSGPVAVDLPVPVGEHAVTDVLAAFGQHPWLWTEDLLADLHSRYHG